MNPRAGRPLNTSGPVVAAPVAVSNRTESGRLTIFPNAVGARPPLSVRRIQPFWEVVETSTFTANSFAELKGPFVAWVEPLIMGMVVTLQHRVLGGGTPKWSL